MIHWFGLFSDSKSDFNSDLSESDALKLLNNVDPDSEPSQDKFGFLISDKNGNFIKRYVRSYDMDYETVSYDICEPYSPIKEDYSVSKNVIASFDGLFSYAEVIDCNFEEVKRFGGSSDVYHYVVNVIETDYHDKNVELKKQLNALTTLAGDDSSIINFDHYSFAEAIHEFECGSLVNKVYGFSVTDTNGQILAGGKFGLDMSDPVAAPEGTEAKSDMLFILHSVYALPSVRGKSIGATIKAALAGALKELCFGEDGFFEAAKQRIDSVIFHYNAEIHSQTGEDFSYSLADNLYDSVATRLSDMGIDSESDIRVDM